MTLQKLPAYFREVAKLRARPQRLASLSTPLPGVTLSWFADAPSDAPWKLTIQSDAGHLYRRAHTAMRHQQLFALGIGHWESESLLLLELAATLDLDTGQLIFEMNQAAPPSLHPSALLAHGSVEEALVRELMDASMGSIEAAQRVVQRVNTLLGTANPPPEIGNMIAQLEPKLWLMRSGDPDQLRVWHAITAQAVRGQKLSPPLRAVAGTPERAPSDWNAPPLRDHAARLGEILGNGATGVTVYAGAGCGKTTTGANLVLDALEQGKRVLVCAGNPAALDIFRQRLHPSCVAFALCLPERERDGAAHMVKGNLRQLSEAMAVSHAPEQIATLQSARTLWAHAKKKMDESAPSLRPVGDRSVITDHLRDAGLHRWIARYLPKLLESQTVAQIQRDWSASMPHLTATAPAQRVLTALQEPLPAPRIVASWSHGTVGSIPRNPAKQEIPTAWRKSTFRTLLRQRTALRRSAAAADLLATLEAHGQTPGMLREAASALREVADLAPEWRHPSLRHWLGLTHTQLQSTLDAASLLNRCKANGAAFLDYLLNVRLRAAWLTLAGTAWTCTWQPWPNPARIEPIARAALARHTSLSRLEPIIGTHLTKNALADRALAMRLSVALQALSTWHHPLPTAGTAEAARQGWLDDCEIQLAALRWRARNARIMALRSRLEHLQQEPLARDLDRALSERNLNAYQTLFEHLESARHNHSTAIPESLQLHLPAILEPLRLHADAKVWQTRARAFESAHSWLSQHRLLRAARKNQRRATEATQAVLQACREQRQEGLSDAAKASHRERFQRVGRHHLIAWGKAVERIGKGTGRHAWLHRHDAMQHLRAALPALPLVLATPNALAQHLEETGPLFDLLVIDEATQLGVETAYLLHLAERAVIIGDDAQLATPQIGVSRARQQLLRRQMLEEHPFADALTAANSLFDVAEVAFTEQVLLRDHYRCHPDILGFSNETSYGDSPLRPMRQPTDRPLGAPLEWVRVQAAPSADDGPQQEVESIAQRVQQIVEDPLFANRSIAVISLRGPAQAQAIDTLLRRRLAPDVWKRHHLKVGLAYHFQGSEYDVAILSMALHPAGRAKALTRDDDRRRFNVAMTRARHKVIVFSSVSPEALRPGCLRRQLLEHLSAYCGPGQTPEPGTVLPLQALPALATPARQREYPNPTERTNGAASAAS